MSEEIVTHSISTSERLVVQAVVRLEERDGDDDPKPWIIHDYLTATWLPKDKTVVDRYANGDYWLISGDNCGTNELILYPYQLDAMIDLLLALRWAEK